MSESLGEALCDSFTLDSDADMGGRNEWDEFGGCCIVVEALLVCGKGFGMHVIGDRFEARGSIWFEDVEEKNVASTDIWRIRVCCPWSKEDVPVLVLLFRGLKQCLELILC